MDLSSRCGLTSMFFCSPHVVDWLLCYLFSSHFGLPYMFICFPHVLSVFLTFWIEFDNCFPHVLDWLLCLSVFLKFLTDFRIILLTIWIDFYVTVYRYRTVWIDFYVYIFTSRFGLTSMFIFLHPVIDCLLHMLICFPHLPRHVVIVRVLVVRAILLLLRNR